MKDTINRIESKLDRVSDDISKINVTLAKQAVSLDEHIRRTNILEAKVGPMESKWDMVIGLGKGLALLAIIGGIGESIILALSFLKGIKL